MCLLCLRCVFRILILVRIPIVLCYVVLCGVVWCCTVIRVIRFVAPCVGDLIRVLIVNPTRDLVSVAVRWNWDLRSSETGFYADEGKGIFGGRNPAHLISNPAS